MKNKRKRKRQIEMSGSVLKQKVLKYIKIKDTEKYKKADRFIKDTNILFNKIKEEMKRKDITEIWVEDEENKYLLSFKITEYTRVDTELMPLDEKEKYIVNCMRWAEQITKLKKD